MMTNSENKMLQSAYDLAKQGFHVFPVNRAEKKPLIKGWTNSKATTDPTTIEKWWRGKFEGANVAVSTGMSDIVVVDVDLRHNGEDTIAAWQREYDTDFIKTVTARSGTGGPHFYFRSNGKRYGNTQATIGKGIDTKAIGGFVVAPHSIHANNNQYRWEKGFSPEEREMLLLPEWLEKMLPAASQKNNNVVRAKKIKEKERGIRARRAISSCPNPLTGEITGEVLHALDANIIFAISAAHFLGMPTNIELEHEFHCILPGHFDTHPSASFGRHDDGHYYYHDFHHGKYDSPPNFTFAEVFAAQETGRVQKLNKVSHATWKLRLLVEMGWLEPATVSILPLPDYATKTVQKVYEGFHLLLQCKWLYDYGAPTAFSWQFASEWCGVAEDTAAKAFKALQAMKIVQEVGSYSRPYGKTMKVFLPYPV